MIAIILSMVSVAGAVGISRTGLGPPAILASRYITLTTPLLCAIYIAWLVYGNAPARLGMHLGLAALMCLALPNGRQFSRDLGSHVRQVELRVERALRGHVPAELLLNRACSAIYIDPKITQEYFRMLKAARVGAFTEFEEPQVASTPEKIGQVRR
jgi:hypothetical protein